FSPPSVDLKMPLPTETLLRVQLSPVPTHTMSGFDRSIVTAPIDCTGCRSNTGLKVVPPFTDFHTPPLAEPANSVTWPFFSIPSTAAMRPLMVAEPMLRIDNPETVAESNLTPCCAAATHASERIAGKSILLMEEPRAIRIMESPRDVWLKNLGTSFTF